MDTNERFSNGGAHDEGKHLEACWAKAQAAKKRKEAEKKRLRRLRNEAYQKKKNATNKGGQARKSAMKQRNTWMPGIC